MKRILGAVRSFFLPPAEAKTFTRLLPIFAVVLLMLTLFAGSTYAWEESNSSVFCGTACHTMPPEYVTYQHSPHTNVACEDCHMGRDRLPVMIGRKIRYSWQTGTAMLFNTYEYPIRAKNMAPARDACENCHKPEKFSTDTLVENRHFAEDEKNSQTSTFLVVKTGGGSSRQGLGNGIHWHIENPVLFYASDAQQQEIPYVVVQQPDGSQVSYVDVEADFDPASVDPAQLVQMDCITCHNRTAHLVDSPSDLMDDLLERGLVSNELAFIKKRGVEVLSADYTDPASAAQAIDALAGEYPDQAELAGAAVEAIQAAWQQANFPDQEVDWRTHANNLAHKDSPGCLRCHDGKHLSEAGEAVRLECNLCHSVPVVSGPRQITANLELSKGFEPDSHKHPNWISLHNQVFDDSCAGCHSVEDAGGSSNTSFCSNSACHGATWEFAGFDAPGLRVILIAQAEEIAAQPTSAPVSGPLTYTDAIGPMLDSVCGTCHGAAAMQGLDVTTYATLMQGGESGAAILPGDPQGSKIVELQRGGEHPGQLDAEQLQALEQWIEEGAPEE